MIRKDKVLGNVAVGDDQSIDADRFERPFRAGASGDPANEHDACSIGSARKSGMKSSRSMMRLAYSCGTRTGRVVCGQYPAMSGMATAGTLASTRALFGLSHVFPQSSIRYGPRGFGDSSSALAGDIRSVPAAPVAVAKTVRRMVTSLVADMVRLLCLRTRCIMRLAVSRS